MRILPLLTAVAGATRAPVTALAVISMTVAAIVLSTPPARAQSQETDTEYVCPPCGMECDEAVHAAPGTCDACGMALVTREEAAATAAARRRAAILLFDGVQIIDFTGPYEVLGQAGFDVVTVARTTEPLTTAMGMVVTPAHDFAAAPAVDVLVVPGGDVNAASTDEETLAWVKETAAGAQHTLSVCNGAFILAAAGLLEGKSATTFYGLIDELREAAPGTNVVRGRRYVDNGRVMTTAGLSSGIDGTLALVATMLGRGRAQEVALHIEYDWRPDSDFARAAFPDLLIPRMQIEGLADVRTVSTQGSRERWDKVWSFSSDLSANEIGRRIAAQLGESGWRREDGSAVGDSSIWTFRDQNEAAWTGAMTLATDPEHNGAFRLSVVLARRGAETAG